MSDTKKTTKITAVAASLALAASSGMYAGSIYNSTANAEEVATVSVPEDEDIAVIASNDADIDEETDDAIDEEGIMELSDEGDEEFGDSEDDDSTYTAPVMDSSPTIQVTPNGTLSVDPKAAGTANTVKVKLTQVGPTVKNDGFPGMILSLDAPPAGFTVEDVVVKSGTNVLASLSDKPEGICGKIESNAGGYTFTFDEEYLAQDSFYTGKTFEMEMTLRGPKTLSDISSYVDSSKLDDENWNGKVTIPFEAHGSTTALNPDPLYVGGTVAADATSEMEVSTPKLSINKNVSREKAQVFDEVKYTITVSNNSAGTVARNVIVTDKENGDPLHAFGITPGEIPAKIKRGSTVEEITPTLSNGDLTFPSFDLASGETVTIEYMIKTAKENTDGVLAEFLKMDGGEGFAERQVKATASNMFFEPSVNVFYNMLIPTIELNGAATSSAATLTTGQKANLTFKFKVGGEDGAKLINPVIRIPAPIGGISDNDVKVNGVACTPGQPIQGTYQKGDEITVTYGVSAPKGLSNDDITASAELSADNVAASATSTVKMGVAIPSYTSKIEVSTMTPSAADESGKAVPVHVKATFEQTNAKATGTGIQFMITDKPEKAGEEAAESVFSNVKINGTDALSSEYRITGNQMFINRATMAGGEKIIVEYDDYMKVGYEANGLRQMQEAVVQANKSVSTNFPEGHAPSARSEFTVQIPQLHIAKEVTDPLLEVTDGEGEDATTTTTPAVINVGDVVKFKTTFFEGNENMASAIGRDFVLTESIEDLFISNEKESDKKANEEASTPDNEDRDIATIASDAKKDGRTYKASQLGITFCPVDEIRVMSGETDVTDNYNVRLSDDASQITVTALNKDAELSGDLTKTPTDLVFSVKMGKAEEGNNFDQLAGKDIRVVSELGVSNLAASARAVSTTTIADADIRMTMEVKDKEITVGDTDEYTIKVVNDPDDKFDNSSRARNLRIEDDLDAAAAAFGYKIDRATLKVMLGDEDITSTSDVVVLWSEGDTGFDLTLSEELAKGDELTITYDATTASIPAASYSQTMGDVVIATADNSKPAAASANVNYIGQDLPAVAVGEEGSLDDDLANTGKDGSIGATGDVLPFVIGGVMAVAVAGGVVFLVVRRRRG